MQSGSETNYCSGPHVNDTTTACTVKYPMHSTRTACPLESSVGTSTGLDGTDHGQHKQARKGKRRWSLLTQQLRVYTHPEANLHNITQTLFAATLHITCARVSDAEAATAAVGEGAGAHGDRQAGAAARGAAGGAPAGARRQRGARREAGDAQR